MLYYANESVAKRLYKLQLGNNAISTVNEVRDLAVIIDNDLKFTAHVNNFVAILGS